MRGVQEENGKGGVVQKMEKNMLVLDAIVKLLVGKFDPTFSLHFPLTLLCNLKSSPSPLEV